MQKWEYKTIQQDAQWQWVGGNNKIVGWTPNVVSRLPELGDQGWELVTVVAGSGGTGTYAGTTSEWFWIFKRPKS